MQRTVKNIIIKYWIGAKEEHNRLTLFLCLTLNFVSMTCHTTVGKACNSFHACRSGLEDTKTACSFIESWPPSADPYLFNYFNFIDIYRLYCPLTMPASGIDACSDIAFPTLANEIKSFLGRRNFSAVS